MDERLDWFPFYPGRFLTDRLVATLLPEQVGAYWKLASHEWLHGPLPVDVSRMAPLVGVTPDRMAELWEVIGPAFTATDDGFVLGWLEDIREEQQGKMDQRRRAGRKGAKSRWGTGKKPARGTDAPANAGANAPANAAAMEPAQEKHSGDLSFSLSSEPERSLEEEFGEWWKAYPKRAGNNPRGEALKLYGRARARGVPAAVLLAAAKRYAALMEAEGSVGSGFVLQAVTWLGDRTRGWEQPWDLPVTAGAGTAPRRDRPVGEATTSVAPGFRK